MREKNWSEQVARQAVWLSGQTDYDQAAEIMREVGQIEISDTSVWRRTQKWGEKIRNMENREQQQAHSVQAAGEVMKRMVHSLGRKGVSMDGTMIYIRDEEWKELKVGCVFDVVVLPTVDPETKDILELGHALRNTYVSHLGGPEEFGRKLWTEAERRHWLEAADTQVVADGATWIWNLVQDYFYNSHQVVDWFHAKEHLANAARLICGEDSSALKRWLKKQAKNLFQGHAERVAKTITDAVEQHPGLDEDLMKEAGYFENNKRRMNYLDLRSGGWLIGSGTVESGAKQFKGRFSGAGMRWSRNGAENLLPIRAAIMSKRFDSRWRAVYYNSPPS